jgi:hypothetical protein
MVKAGAAKIRRGLAHRKKMFVRVKHASLSRQCVNDGPEKLYNIGPTAREKLQNDGKGKIQGLIFLWMEVNQGPLY